MGKRIKFLLSSMDILKKVEILEKTGRVCTTGESLELRNQFIPYWYLLKNTPCFTPSFPDRLILRRMEGFLSSSCRNLSIPQACDCGAGSKYF